MWNLAQAELEYQRGKHCSLRPLRCDFASCGTA